MTARTAPRRTGLTIAEILAFPAVVPLVPDVARTLVIPDSTIYQLAAENRLPFPTIRIGRRLYVRTVELWEFLGLVPLASKDDDSAGVASPTPSVEHINAATDK